MTGQVEREYKTKNTLYKVVLVILKELFGDP